MIYYISSASIVSTALGAILSLIFIKKRKCALVFSLVTVALSALGAALSTYSAVSLGAVLREKTLSKEFVSWAKDTFSSYLKGVCLVSGIVIVLCVLSFFLRPKQKFIRAILIFLTAAAILSATPVFAYLSEGSAVDVSRYIKISGTGISLITFFPLFFDYYRISRNGREITEKK